MENVDWQSARNYWAAACVSSICASVLFIFTFVYLIQGDFAWVGITAGIGIAFSLHSRASAARCAAALSGYSMSPYTALKSWGGTFRILFPPKAVILPPSE